MNKDICSWPKEKKDSLVIRSSIEETQGVVIVHESEEIEFIPKLTSYLTYRFLPEIRKRTY